MCVGCWAGVTYLRYTVLESPNKDEAAVHCCDPALSVLVMLVSRNVFHVVSALQFIVSFRDFTTLFLVIFRRDPSEWLGSPIKTDLSTRFAICSLDFTIRHFTFFMQCRLYKNISFKRVSYLLIFVARENGIFIPS